MGGFVTQFWFNLEDLLQVKHDFKAKNLLQIGLEMIKL